jgi:hypothetical protein
MGISIPQPFQAKVVGPVAVDLLSTSINLGVTLSAITATLNLSPITINPLHFSIDALPPIDIRLTQLPSIRAHLPVDMGVCMSLFGVDLVGVRLCGEAQMITEPYLPNSCERCSGDRRLVAANDEPDPS